MTDKNNYSLSIKPVHIWWIGVFLFLPSCLFWGWSSAVSIWKFKQFALLDWHGLTHAYFPMLAAIVGLSIPLACLHRLRDFSLKATLVAFSSFVALMLTWGIVDIRSGHYQIGGHDYPNGPLVDGHRYYWHIYFTWYFLPYRWIEGYAFN